MSEPVVSERFPYLLVTAEVRGREYEVELLIDTGFDGDLILPPLMVGDIGPPDFRLGASLADGSRISVAAYRASARVSNRPSIPIVML